MSYRKVSKKIASDKQHKLVFIMQPFDEPDPDPYASELAYVMAFATDRLIAEINDDANFDHEPLPRNWTYG